MRRFINFKGQSKIITLSKYIHKKFVRLKKVDIKNSGRESDGDIQEEVRKLTIEDLQKDKIVKYNGKLYQECDIEKINRLSHIQQEIY